MSSITRLVAAFNDLCVHHSHCVGNARKIKSPGARPERCARRAQDHPREVRVVWKKQRGGSWKAEADVFNTDK
jgi:hypothetical protein